MTNLNQVIGEVAGNSETATAVFEELRTFKKFHDNLNIATFQARIIKRMEETGRTFDAGSFYKAFMLMNEKGVGSIVYSGKGARFKPEYSLRDIALASGGEWLPTDEAALAAIAPGVSVPAADAVEEIVSKAPYDRAAAMKARWAAGKMRNAGRKKDSVEAPARPATRKKAAKRGRPAGFKMTPAQKKKWMAARWPKHFKHTASKKAEKAPSKKKQLSAAAISRIVAKAVAQALKAVA